MKRLYKSRLFHIGMLCVVMGVIFFIRCYNREPSGDEIYYEYVWESDDITDFREPEHKYLRRISSWNDILQTQIIHYFHMNGRVLIHTVEQAFTDHTLAFSIVNTMVFLTFVSLIVYYVAPKGRRGNYLLWLLVFIVVALFFPQAHTLWPSVNFGLNYLWPSTLSVAVLILWDKIRKGHLDKKYTIPTAVLALIFGWSHELFVISVGGSIFFYYCFHFRQFRGQILALALPMWATAAIMIFSPGNIQRYFRAGETAGDAFHMRLVNSVDVLVYARIFFVLLLLWVLVYAFGNRHKLRTFISDNIPLILSLALSLIFTVFASSYEQSVTYIELASMLIIFRYACLTDWKETRVYWAMSSLLTIIFVIQQIFVAEDTVKNYKYQHALVGEYLESPDGLVHYSDSFLRPTSRPYVKTWGEIDFYAKTISHVHTGYKKPFTLLMDADYQAVSQPDSFFIETNCLPGNAPVYHGEGGHFYWVKPDVLKPGQKLVADLWPVDWHHKNVGILVRMKFLLFPDGYPTKMDLEIDTIQSPRYGRLLRVEIPKVRKVKEINISEKK